jgi:isoleucyl-tRNA synthetase
MHILAGALFEKPAFKNCTVTGMILAEDGKKMSKKLKNYPDPTEVINKYGADATRFYMLSSPVVQAENLSFSEKGVDEIVKKNISRLSNVLSFYQLYQNQTPASDNSKNILDAWILSRLNQLIKAVTSGYENYRVDLATRPLTDFIDDFSVWYLRRSRDRFKDESSDKTDALSTLRYVLYNLSLVMAPAMPFLAEYIFSATKENSDQESVHLCNWPKVKEIDQDLLSKMQEVRDIVAKALGERVIKGIKVKQPLANLKVKNLKSKIQNNEELLGLIKDEVNVKEIIFDTSTSSGQAEIEVELDTNLTDELKEEGVLREIVRALQGERKNQNLVPSDKISVKLSAPEYEKNIIEKNKDLLLKEFRATEITTEVGTELKIEVTKI